MRKADFFFDSSKIKKCVKKNGRENRESSSVKTNKSIRIDCLGDTWVHVRHESVCGKWHKKSCEHLKWNSRSVEWCYSLGGSFIRIDRVTHACQIMECCCESKTKANRQSSILWVASHDWHTDEIEMNKSTQTHTKITLNHHRRYAMKPKWKHSAERWHE